MVFTNTKKITSFTKIIVKVENHKTVKLVKNKPSSCFLFVFISLWILFSFVMRSIFMIVMVTVVTFVSMVVSMATTTNCVITWLPWYHITWQVIVRFDSISGFIRFEFIFQGWAGNGMISATRGQHCAGLLYRWRCCVCRTTSCRIRRTRLARRLHDLRQWNWM